MASQSNSAFFSRNLLLRWISKGVFGFRHRPQVPFVLSVKALPARARVAMAQADDYPSTPMRLLVALLLVLQLDPVIGAALCLQRQQAASEHCTMPDTPASAERSLAPLGTQSDSGCSVASLCLPPAPAIAQIAQDFPFAPPVYWAPAPLEGLTAPRGAFTPPFHPPRV